MRQIFDIISRHYGLCRDAIFAAGDPLETNPVLTNEELEELIDCVMHYEPFARRAVTHDIHGALYEVIDQALALGHHRPIRVLYEYRDQLHDFPHIREFMQEVWAEALPHPSTAEVEFDPDTETSQTGGTAATTVEIHMNKPLVATGWALSLLSFGMIACSIGCCGNGAIGTVAGWWATEDDETEEVVVDLESPWQSPLACDGLTADCPWMNGGSGESLDEVYAFPLRGDRDRFSDEANGCVRLDRNAADEDVYVLIEPCTAVESGDRASSCPEGQTCLVWTGPEGNLETIHRGCLQPALGEPSTWEGACPIVSVRDR